MNAKNISKDRNGSRNREDKKEKFNRGAEQMTSDEEKMDEDNEHEPGNSHQSRTHGKRQRDPPKTGDHDNTMGDDSDDELPGAKRSMGNIRERLTHVYEKKTKATREMRDETKTIPSVQFDVDVSNAGEKVKHATKPLLEPTKLENAPTITLKDLVPEQDKEEIEGDDAEKSFKVERVEFVVVEREIIPGEEDPARRSDRDYDWDIPDRSSFDEIIGRTIELYTEDDWELLDYMSFSSVGWNTGVGLFAFGSDRGEQMQKFRAVLRGIQVGNKRYESYPKRMLLNRYAITIYFNSAFQWTETPKLLFWFRKLNGFDGDLTMVDTKHYPKDHPTRKGCRIVSCDADQKFLDELYRYPKDHAFGIRFGGNLYVPGGERIDPDDPQAVRQRRPRLSRVAARKFLAGSSEDVLKKGQQADDAATRAAQQEHMNKHLCSALFLNIMHKWGSNKGFFKSNLNHIRQSPCTDVKKQIQKWCGRGSNERTRTRSWWCKCKVVNSEGVNSIIHFKLKVKEDRSVSPYKSKGVMSFYFVIYWKIMGGVYHGESVN